MAFYNKPRNCRRPARTCRECRRRKVKCSRNAPCTNCVRMQHECVYSTYGTTSVCTNGERPCQQSSSSLDYSPSILDRWVGGVHSRYEKDNATITSHSFQGDPDVVLNGADHDSKHTKRSPDPQMACLRDQIEDLEQVFKTRALDYAGKREMYSAQPMLCDGRAAMNKSRIFGRSHWLHTAYHVCCGLFRNAFDGADTFAVFGDARLLQSSIW